MKLRCKTKPVDLFDDMSKVRHHCRIDDDLSGEDDYLKVLVRAVVGLAEAELSRPLLCQQWEKLIDLPADQLTLKPDVVSVESVSLVLDDGSEIPLPSSGYRLVLQRRLVMVGAIPANAVAMRCVFTCGAFDAPDQVPDSIRHWVLLNVGALYENRETVVTGAVVSPLPRSITDGLLDEWRVYG